MALGGRGNRLRVRYTRRMTRPNRELIAYLGIALVAFALRAAAPTRMQIEHFDEGVYASNLYGTHIGNRYPAQHLYAPPFLPALLEWTLIFTGSPHAVMWVNVVAGTLFVLAVGGLTRCWFGAPAGLLAALLAATNDQAILFSRAALTDTLVCLWIVLAVWAGWRAITNQDQRWAIGAGCLTALAWWTKYNGWLPLAILGSGGAAWCLMSKAPSRQVRSSAPVMFVTTLCAVALWAPWVWQLQSAGGYTAVAANHRQYVDGFARWLPNLIRHWQVERFHTSPIAVVGWAAAISFTLWSGWKESDSKRATQTGLAALVLGLLAGALVATIGSMPLLLASAICTAVSLLRSRGGDDAPETHRLQTLGLWHAIAWFVGLSLAVPLYRPYPRLLLPWLTVGWIVAGGTLAKWLTSGASSSEPAHRMSHWLGIAGAGLLLLAVTQFALPARLRPVISSPVCWEDRSDLKQIAEKIVGDLAPGRLDSFSSRLSGIERVLYVLAEPGLYFHLAAAEFEGRGRHATQPAANLGMLEPGSVDARVPTFLITGLHAHRDNPLLLEGEIAATLVAEYPYTPSDLVLLDDVAPDGLASQRDQVVRLWRIEPAASGTAPPSTR